jgi:cation transporter-like permease
MLFEVARPVTLIFCILSLSSVFNVAFLVPSIDMRQRIRDSLVLLALAAVISLISGLIFRDSNHEPEAGTRLAATLPIQMFCWAASIMLVLFVVSWYLETYCVFYRDVRY